MYCDPFRFVHFVSVISMYANFIYAMLFLCAKFLCSSFPFLFANDKGGEEFVVSFVFL